MSTAGSSKYARSDTTDDAIVERTKYNLREGARARTEVGFRTFKVQLAKTMESEGEGERPIERHERRLAQFDRMLDTTFATFDSCMKDICKLGNQRDHMNKMFELRMANFHQKQQEDFKRISGGLEEVRAAKDRKEAAKDSQKESKQARQARMRAAENSQPLDDEAAPAPAARPLARQSSLERSRGKQEATAAVSAPPRLNRQGSSGKSAAAAIGYHATAAVALPPGVTGSVRKRFIAPVAAAVEQPGSQQEEEEAAPKLKRKSSGGPRIAPPSAAQKKAKVVEAAEDDEAEEVDQEDDGDDSGMGMFREAADSVNRNSQAAAFSQSQDFSFD